MTYQQALDYLYSSLPMYQHIGDKAFNKDLRNTLALCAALNNPHQKFKSVHIAGTNGKGTSAHTIAAILQSAGYKTGLYTSPHLKSFTERIRIDGKKIEESLVTGFVANHQKLLEDIKPSFFETTVVMAFDHFVKEQVDIAVIEVGMGGRFDSTNVINPEVSLITQIGYDHQQFLGDTLEKIAFEKAGIIKPGVPVVIGADQPELLGVFEEKASLGNAQLQTANHVVVNETDSKGDPSLVNIEGFPTKLNHVELSLKGKYYLKNIPGILETITQLNQRGYQIDENSIRKGFANVQTLTGLKGRWQKLSDSPLTICDIGHNEDGINAILRQISQIKYNDLHIVFGTVKDKDLGKILSPLPKKAKYYFCQADIPRALAAEKLRISAASFGLSGQAFQNVNLALVAAQKIAQPQDLIFVGGSTFVVAEINDL